MHVGNILAQQILKYEHKLHYIHIFFFIHIYISWTARGTSTKCHTFPYEDSAKIT